MKANLCKYDDDDTTLWGRSQIEGKAGKPDLEKAKAIDVSGDLISEKCSGNQKDGQVSVNQYFVFFIQDSHFMEEKHWTGLVN